MIGLKLWSINTDYYLEAAKSLYRDGWFDYIELYYIPDSFDTVSVWSKLDIPFTLHAPHTVHGVNLADKDNFSENQRVYNQLKEFKERLSAKYVIVHSGMDGCIEESVRQLKLFSLEDILIENKPYRPPRYPERICRGATLDEITFITKELDCGFCLDIGHAICAFNSLKHTLSVQDPYDYVEMLNNLNPVCYHLTDNYIDSDMDRHLHLGQGNYDMERLSKIIDFSKDVSLETNKDSKYDLDDFKHDVMWSRQWYK